MSNNNRTDGCAVFFHIFMTIITCGVWIPILIIWLIIKAASQK